MIAIEDKIDFLRDRLPEEYESPYPRMWLREIARHIRQQEREINELRNADYHSKMLSLHMDDISDIVQEAIAEMGGKSTRRDLWNSASNEVINAFQKYFDEHLIITLKDETNEEIN